MADSVTNNHKPLNTEVTMTEVDMNLAHCFD